MTRKIFTEGSPVLVALMIVATVSACARYYRTQTFTQPVMADTHVSELVSSR